MTIESISLGKITVDDSLQVREYIDGETVTSYKLLMREGQLPPIDVFKIGSKYLLAGGWHRLEAAGSLKWTVIDCKVHEGDRRAAVLFAAGGNAHHGRPLTRNEKREAVKTLLPDDEWFQWSNAKIGRHCGLSAPTVAMIRDHFVNEEARKLAGSRGSLKNSLSDKRKRVDKHGNVSTIDTTNIGRKPRCQADKNLADLNGALETIAALPFTATYALETFADRITDKAAAAAEWVADLRLAKRTANLKKVERHASRLPRKSR